MVALVNFLGDVCLLRFVCCCKLFVGNIGYLIICVFWMNCAWQYVKAPGKSNREDMKREIVYTISP